MFACPMCSRAFTSRGNVNAHMIIHTKEKPYKCVTCSSAYGKSCHLKRHIKFVHEGPKTNIKKNYECPVCSYKSTGLAKLKVHLRKHSTEKPFSYNLTGCGFKTKYGSSLSNHIRGVHGNERRHKCSSSGCNFKTSLLGNLYAHLKVHRSEKPFVCTFPECNFASKWNVNLGKHIYSAHSEEKHLSCSTCDFRTKYKSRLREHQDQHRNIKRLHCKASKCKFATHSSHHLQLHFDRQHREKDVKCKAPGCYYRCGTAALLQMHAQKHKLPILKCPSDSCNYRTRFLRSLHSHVSRKHKEVHSFSVRVAENSAEQTVGFAGGDETLICTYPGCHYQTEFQHRYETHTKTHDLAKCKYSCKLCPYRCRSSSRLECHVRTHVGEKPYRCSLCKYTTINSTLLKLHSKRIHHIHLIPCGKENQNLMQCRTCSFTSPSYTEFLLHSMSHLKAVVVLERLNLHFM